ncbi:hypothetical protein NO1_2192 [Candidatus Termititenax aidoneus]|uniref:Uncharacterized protein n=1 Tax=Termititenax aidoneus TaxID=2218524 RepID=A0A388TEQ0_TERA1|nr:hypothetical protein NO1_2192 [Candidatus Termititenax aidoneus]
MKLKKIGFTLIELLVVVLIIGILAAIALPQYQRAVWKSRAAQLQQSVKALANAQEMYFLVHGKYPTNFDELDISFDSLPDKPAFTAQWPVNSANAIRANDIMELVISNMGSNDEIAMSVGVFIKGKFERSGFLYVHNVGGIFSNGGGLDKNRRYCFENGIITQGDFCNKIMGYSSSHISGSESIFPIN